MLQYVSTIHKSCLQHRGQSAAKNTIPTVQKVEEVTNNARITIAPIALYRSPKGFCPNVTTLNNHFKGKPGSQLAPYKQLGSSLHYRTHNSACPLHYYIQHVHQIPACHTVSSCNQIFRQSFWK